MSMKATRFFAGAARINATGKPCARAAFKRVALAAALALACAALSSCAALNSVLYAEPATQTTVSGPNLSLLSLPAYDDPEASAAQTQDAGTAYSNVDFWLDATQNMGGINANTDSMYPHKGRKYREGGFQYHYGNTSGWYESLLRDFLSAAGETHVRTLRYGNETLSADYLANCGLSADDASVWRDLHTCDVDTTPGLFSQFSGEDMTGSFYALGSSVWVNRLPLLNASDLENPTLSQAMSSALDGVKAGVAAGDSSFVLQAGRDGQQCALLSALENLDLDKLSVITVDPASVRKTVGADAQGQPIEYYTQLLAERGVFDKGLCVGVLDFQLDYMGQMSSFSTATFSEPLIWGRVILNEKKQTFLELGVMPRHMLTLVIGTRARVDAFIQALGTAIDADTSLKGQRGPDNGELTYAADGQTVTQQPFGFEWHSTVIARPSVGYYSQHTQGAALAAEATESADGAQTVTGDTGVPLVSLTPGSGGAQPDRTFTVRFPLAQGDDGTTLDVSTLGNASIQAINTLLLTKTLPNTAQNLAAVQSDGETSVAYRDQLYVFETDAQTSAFSLKNIALENGELVCTLSVRGSELKPGYYRLRLSADATGAQVAWETVPWIDGDQSVSTSVTDAQVYDWETFTAAITQYDRDAKGLPKMFTHAWGPYTDKLYHSLRVPDFPPVYKSVHLAELATQFRSAAASDQSALIRYVFEVFVAYP